MLITHKGIGSTSRTIGFWPPVLGRGIVAFCAIAVVGVLLLPPRAEITLVAVGDVMLARGVDKKIEQHGADWPFALTADISRSADIAFCNLECPFSRDAPLLPKRFAFRADPDCARALARAGYDVACLANNHAMDCHRAGLTDTMRALADAGVQYVGAGNDERSARAPLVVRRRGVRIAFLARSMFRPYRVSVLEDWPTIAVLDPDAIASQVRAAARKADVVVVSLHWGIEYSSRPSDWQRRLAHQIADAGADIVIGHHSHSVQEVERYRGAVIAYSLGNFVFHSRRERARQGLMLRCGLDRNGLVEVDTIPTVLEQYRPRPVRSDSAGKRPRASHAKAQAERPGPWVCVRKPTGYPAAALRYVSLTSSRSITCGSTSTFRFGWPVVPANGGGGGGGGGGPLSSLAV